MLFKCVVYEFVLIVENISMYINFILKKIFVSFKIVCFYC